MGLIRGPRNSASDASDAELRLSPGIIPVSFVISRSGKAHSHLLCGEGPFVGKLGDSFVGRAVAVGTLGFDANENWAAACLCGLHGCGEFERMTGDDAVVVICRRHERCG